MKYTIKEFKDNYLDPRRLGSTIVFILIPTLLFHYGITKDWNTTVLFATLMAIIIYTWKTWQLKDLTSKEITYKIRPFIVFEPTHSVLKNIGNGIALNIKIDNIPIEKCAPYKSNSVVEITFEKIGSLNKTPFQGLKIKGLSLQKVPVELDSPIYNAILDSNQIISMKKFKMLISFEDIEGKKYYTHMAVEGERFQVVKG